MSNQPPIYVVLELTSASYQVLEYRHHDSAPRYRPYAKMNSFKDACDLVTRLNNTTPTQYRYGSVRIEEVT